MGVGHRRAAWPVYNGPTLGEWRKNTITSKREIRGETNWIAKVVDAGKRKGRRSASPAKGAHPPTRMPTLHSNILQGIKPEYSTTNVLDPMIIRGVKSKYVEAHCELRNDHVRRFY